MRNLLATLSLSSRSRANLFEQVQHLQCLFQWLAHRQLLHRQSVFSAPHQRTPRSEWPFKFSRMYVVLKTCVPFQRSSSLGQDFEWMESPSKPWQQRLPPCQALCVCSPASSSFTNRIFCTCVSGRWRCRSAASPVARTGSTQPPSRPASTVARAASASTAGTPRENANFS